MNIKQSSAALKAVDGFLKSQGVRLGPNSTMELVELMVVALATQPPQDERGQGLLNQILQIADLYRNSSMTEGDFACRVIDAIQAEPAQPVALSRQRRIIRSQSCRVCEGIGQWHDNEGDNDDYCNACNGTGIEPVALSTLTDRQIAKALVAARIPENATCTCEHHLAIAHAILAASAPAQQAGQGEPCGAREHCGRFPFCGCGGPDRLPERDTSKPAEQQGLFRKFDVRRTDGSDGPGGKHAGCEYFVLDVTHDQHAKAALTAYAESVNATHQILATEMRDRYNLPSTPPQPVAAEVQALIDELDEAAERITRYSNNPLDGLLSAAARMIENLAAFIPAQKGSHD